jgi:hypothetical protein
LDFLFAYIIDEKIYAKEVNPAYAVFDKTGAFIIARKKSGMMFYTKKTAKE